MQNPSELPIQNLKPMGDCESRPRRTRWWLGAVLLWGILLSMFTECARAQVPRLIRPDPSRGLPAGVQVTQISVHAGSVSLTLPATIAVPAASSDLGRIIDGGISANVGWYVPGGRSEAF